MLTITHAETPEEIEQFEELVAEYKAWDIQMSARMGLDVDTLLDFDYKSTVRELVAEFVPPYGRLLLASFDGQLAGCAGLHRLTPEIGEMKRVYVRPAFRGRGFGKALIEAVVAEARLISYRTTRDGQLHERRAIAVPIARLLSH
jgi:N-acetylglutamate synthase-like GNAT family acetyltransferase